MYCPVCINDTLKIASSGVVKLTFNKKSKATSQFFYNLSEDSDEEILEKLKAVVVDYFEYYGNFQNKDIIQRVEGVSIDFKCSNGCVLSVNNRVNVIGLIFSKEEITTIMQELAPKYQIEVDLKWK